MLVHGANLAQKEASTRKYNDDHSNRLLADIRHKYDQWHQANMALQGPFLDILERDERIIQERIKLLNEYKDFIDQQIYAEHFDSRSNLHSTVLEEFLYYLFKDILQTYGQSVLVGKSHTFKDLFFAPPSYSSLVYTPHARIEKKDHDFVIGVRVRASLICEGSDALEVHEFDLPAVAIECKTYLDKTMLEGAATSASQLKARNPNALYMVVAEWLKLSDTVNLQKYSTIDQIYILRKQKNTDREFRFDESYQKNPIYADVVWHLFTLVRHHLTSDWEGGVEYGLSRGWLV